MRFFGNLSACTVVMEACAGSHIVARELMTMGHQAKLISPQFVRPFVKRNKNDFVDAEVIGEWVNSVLAPTPRSLWHEPDAPNKKALVRQFYGDKKVFLIAFNYYTCGAQNIDDIILMASFDEFLSSVLPNMCQRLG